MPSQKTDPGPLALVIESDLAYVDKLQFGYRGAVFIQSSKQVIAVSKSVMTIWIDARVSEQERDRIIGLIKSRKAAVYKDSSELHKLKSALDRRLPPLPAAKGLPMPEATDRKSMIAREDPRLEEIRGLRREIEALTFDREQVTRLEGLLAGKKELARNLQAQLEQARAAEKLAKSLLTQAQVQLRANKSTEQPVTELVAELSRAKARIRELEKESKPAAPTSHTDTELVREAKSILDQMNQLMWGFDASMANARRNTFGRAHPGSDKELFAKFVSDIDDQLNLLRDAFRALRRLIGPKELRPEQPDQPRERSTVVVNLADSPLGRALMSKRRRRG